MNKEEIRPFYSELQGYLSQTPRPENPVDSIEDSGVWETFNEIVSTLEQITKESLKRLKIVPTQAASYENKYEYIRVSLYRQKLGGLILHLHGKYFKDEPAPFSGGGPSTVVTQSQEQIQSTHIEIILNLQSRIDEKLRELPEGSKEKTFLKKLKDSLSKVKNTSELMATFLNLANQLGLSLQEVTSLDLF